MQSVALRLVCEREKEIRDFKPEPYWILGVRAAKRVEPRDPFTAKLARLNGKKADVRDAAAELGMGQPIELIPQLSDPKNLFGLLHTRSPLLRVVA